MPAPTPRKGRTVYWRWEYRLRHRPHVLLVADNESVTQLRLVLQARWLCSVATDLEDAIKLACILLPSRIVVDASFPQGTLFIERLKRTQDTHQLPILWLARNEPDTQLGTEAGAQISLITPEIGFEFDAKSVHRALFDLHILPVEPQPDL